MSAHGSGHGARSPPSRGLISGTATSIRYKLNAKLDMLDPTATLAINDWLINLRAAAGSEFKLCFMTRPQLNPADAFTKHVSPKRLWQEYMARMYNSPVGVLAKVMTA